jgi:PIN domain nuclease of toxin-antitoxin system
VRLLLDTNIVIMVAEGGRRLSQAHAALLAHDETIGFVSAVSLWELAIKYRSGKLKLAMTPDQLRELLPQWRMGTLWLSPVHAVTDPDLPPAFKDPFDRMFVAVAERERMTFLSTDAKLLDHPLAWHP